MRVLKPRTMEHTEEAARFFLVALTGLGIDIAIAWALIAFTGAPDAIAAVAGFSVAAAMNYFAHQFWTFRNGERRASMRRFIGFAGAVVLTLAVRLVVLEMLGTVLPGSGMAAPIRLGLAAVASLVASFVLSRFFVFNRQGNTDVQ